MTSRKVFLEVAAVAIFVIAMLALASPACAMVPIPIPQPDLVLLPYIPASLSPCH